MARDTLPGHFYFRLVLRRCLAGRFPAALHNFFQQISVRIIPVRDYFARIPASLLKDAALSPRAKLLYVLLAAHADARTGVTFVGLRRLETLLGCGRAKREQAQRELVLVGWIELRAKRRSSGRWGSRVFVVFSQARGTAAHFQRSGETEQSIFAHSQVSGSQEVPAFPCSSLPTGFD